nr:probable LRR receptor-like serine/threonine-protein kinase At1g05700 [Ipomoea batatas]GMD67149.1 probable LRR receptor-like serine/threonine-protein kinase At1g05700 [Ipomoea batatas]
MDYHILVPIVALLVVSVSALNSVNIDCGSSSSSYKDENGISWSGDDDIFLQNGGSQAVQSTNSINSPVMDSLRVFTSGKKNCYNVEVVEDSQYLIRASFYYGNYDNKASPPTFDLLLDENLWAAVVFEKDEPVHEEVIYVTKWPIVSVCVAQTKPAQFPFISALQVSSLDSSMYGGFSSPSFLQLATRVAFGSNVTIRYPDDAYDRIWGPNGGNMILTNNAPSIDVSIADNPPEAVIWNALTTSNTSIGTAIPALPFPLYINMYLIFRYVLGQRTRLRHYIAALRRRTALVALQKTFAVLEEGSDPCLPAPFSWDWVNCSTDAKPRITALHLAGYGLSGELPEDLGTMDALESIDLGNNSLRGPIPEFLSKLRNLKYLNLADNEFSGPIPASLSTNKNLQLIVTGNPDTCATGKSCETKDIPAFPGSPPPAKSSIRKKKKGGNKLGLILGITIPVGLIIWGLVLTVVILHLRRKRAPVSMADPITELANQQTSQKA